MANALANLFTDIADSIRSKTGSTEKLSPSEFASQIDNISVGGGGAEGCVTVTFMNGANVLLTRPVYIGDDCPDPVTQGRIETPTKESTVQYNYTYKGWSEALTNITEDKVIYATYTSTVRKYTITFYDEDGATVLHTEQVAYGSVPYYTPTKDGFAFDKWTPTPVAVTGNASYTASWSSAIASGTCGATTTWSLSTDYTLTISGTGAMSDYSYNTTPWYSYASQITVVNVLDGVTSIGNNAFYQCTNLVDVNIADSVTSIGEMAFYDCNSLTNIALPNSITSIGDDAFYYCDNLINVHISNIVSWCNIDFTKASQHLLYVQYGKTPRNLYINGVLATDITIPDSVTSIGNYAFYDCDSLTSIDISDSVTSIGNYAFYDCESLTSITIPDSVTSIGDSAFYDCESLTSITIPDSVTSIGASAFTSCTSLTSIAIPDGVINIGKYAFSSCSSLTSITIPDSVTSIGDGAFSSCSSLTSINADGNAYVSIDGVLFDKECTTIITYPAGKNGTEFTIPDNVTSIGSYAFNSCSSLTSITIPDNVTSIGDYAFYACSSLTSITIPDGVTSIGSGTFGSCSSLTSITIPDNVTSIGGSAFNSCSSLTSITIPDSVTSIGSYAFSSCKNLAEAIFVDPKGWKANTTTLSSTSLANSATAANYLATKYYGRVWTKS